MMRSMRLALFSSLIFALTLAIAVANCNAAIDVQIPNPPLSNLEKGVNITLEQEKPRVSGTTTHALNISFNHFVASDFPDSDATNVKISLIVGVKDYNPRIFPNLVQKLSQLQEESQNVPSIFLEILIVHIGPPDAVQYDIINRLSQLFTPKLRYFGPNPPNQAMSFSMAINNAAKFATGDALFFTTDMLSDISVASLLHMAKFLNHPKIGIVAPKLLDAAKGDSSVFSAGIDFVLGKNPHKAIWNSWNADNSGNSALVSSKTDVPFLHYRYQGHLASDSRVTEMKTVYGGSKHGFMILASHWRELNGYDVDLENAYMDMDLSLRSLRLFGKSALYVPEATISVTGQDLLLDDTLNGDFAPNELLKLDNKRFLERWVEPLLEQLTSGWLISNLSIVWSMDCGAGQILGFTTEAVNLVMELQKIVRVKVLNDAAACKNELMKIGFPEATVKTINTLSLRDDREKTTDRFVVVMHKDPRRFDTGYAYNPPDMLIGRSMYESDSIPSDWLEPIQSVDFLWLPTSFNKQTFSSAGVNASKLEIINEAIDLLHFDPHTVQLPSSGVSAPPELLSDRSKFNFISVFKWEARKDWETLLTAFYDEFANPSDAEQVRLYIRSTMAPENTNALTAFQQRYVSESKRPLAQLPKVIVLDRFVSYSKLPHMYKSAQAYVTATHGEGWGLPIMEAMSMGMPVIATNWSGLTEFVTSETGFLVDYSLVNGPQSGHKWAKADLLSLRSAMRQVFAEPTKAAEIGQTARQHLLNKFSARSTAHHIIKLVTEQIPHFASLKSTRPSPTFTYGRNRYNSDSSTGSHYNSNSRTTPVVNNIWSTSATVEKHGQTLTKAKLTE